MVEKTNFQVKEIDISSIFPDPEQPRKNFDIESLAKAIQKNGIVPIEVISEGNKFKIIDGERRFRASKKLGLKTIPCIITDKKDNLLERQLVLDFHKKHFSPVEKARSLKKLKELNNYSNRQLAEELNISPTTVNNLLSILGLSKPLQDVVKQGVNYKLVLKLKDLPLDEQVRIARELLKEIPRKFVRNRIKRYGLSSQKWLGQKKAQQLLEQEGIVLNEGVFSHNKNESIKHFLVKAIIYKIIKEKGRIVGTEIETTNSIADVLDSTNMNVYEVETNATPGNRKEILKQYENVNIKDVFIIDLRKVPNNIIEMEKCLRERIV